jgi:HSP20 family protein
MDPFAQMSQDIDQMFQGMLGDWSGRMNLFNRAGQVFMPTIDVKDTAKEIRATAELPGLEEKDIELSLVDRALWIKGEKREEHEEEKGDVYQCERQYGSVRTYDSAPGPNRRREDQSFVQKRCSESDAAENEGSSIEPSGYRRANVIIRV